MSCRKVAALPDGSPLYAITLRSDQLTATVLSFGAALQDLRLEGHVSPLILGYQNPLDYLKNPSYLGVIVGRVANRISGGKISVNGTVHELDQNENGTSTLHGGRDGSSHRNWALLDHGPTHMTLGDVLPDGHMGFPGRLELNVTYRLDGAALIVELTGKTDAPTVCNPAPHIYFNLDGGSDIEHHNLRVASSRVIPVKNGLPTGSPVPAARLNLDLRTEQAIPQKLDHHFCLSEQVRSPGFAAELLAPGCRMEIFTSEPGLQVYDGSHLDICNCGLESRSYGPRAGVALEPHRWIDAPNQSWSHQVALDHDAVFQAKTHFKFCPA